TRSQSAEYDQHAHAVQAIGLVRAHVGTLSGNVLAARFGLLNHYDSITATELDLSRSVGDLHARFAQVVPVDGELESSISALALATAEQRRVVERFKTENSVLRNSIYYLP